MGRDHRWGGAWIPVIVAVASAVAYVILVTLLPVEVLAGAEYDDAWFWQRGRSIAQGHWLGAYDRMTLMKGSGYPLFLAASHLLGLPLATAQALLYAAACLVLGTAIRRTGAPTWFALLVLLALLWHPAALSWSRIIRDNIAAAQALLALAALLHFLCAVREGARGRAWAALSGWTLAWLWLTREDGLWVVPGLALPLLAAAWWLRGDAPGRRRLLAGVALSLAVFAGTQALVAAVNDGKYGVFASNDFRGGGFSDAMSTLQRVRVGDPVPFVPVPAKVRQVLYAESPTFARLRDRLEAADAPWRTPGCPARSTILEVCGDYAAGAWPWALREAIAAAGGYADARTAVAFNRALASEVAEACAAGRLECTHGFGGLAPPMTAEQWAAIPGIFHGAVRLLFWQGRRDGWGGGHLEAPGARAMWEFTGRPPVHEAPGALGVRMLGWFHHPDGAWLELACVGSGVVPVARRPSPDLARHFDDPAAQASRFSLAVPALAGCDIRSTGDDGSTVALDQVAGDSQIALGGGVLRIDAVQDGIPPSAQARPGARAVRRIISRVHAAAMPWLAASGLLAFAVATLRSGRRRHHGAMWLLAASAWTLVAGRVALLVLVDAAAFPAIRIHYMQPAFPLLSLAVLASLGALLAGAGWDVRQQQRNPPRPP